MTGYGRSHQTFEEQSITIEIKSINSKTFDLRTRLPMHYQSKEIELRRILSNELIRGKVDFNLLVTNSSADFRIDPAAFEAYYFQLSEMAGNLGLEKGDLLYTITRLPGVVTQNDEDVLDEEWKRIELVMKDALKKIQEFRAQEGEALRIDMKMRIELLLELLDQVEPHEQGRMEKVRQRLQANLDMFVQNNKIDENRFEQELLYYIDKLDITEEKTRLQQHCIFFLEVMADETVSLDKGKKLNFIIQEIGREINTMGAKANYADIQRVVVQMKDEADKIKEQLANIL